jgi:hypothetical protein
MPQPKASERLNQLVHALQQAVDRLGEGKLDLAGLDACTEDARAIYERLVVLRHKAREAQVVAEKQPVAAAPATAVENATPAIRLDTRPAEISLHQTSLIDAIAETEATTEAPAANKPKPKAAAPTPPRPQPAAPKVDNVPVADLRKVIALSQKFWFVAELFGNDRKRYEEAIDTLNAMGGLPEAEAYYRKEVVAKLPKPPGDEVANTFLELLQRRFR